MKHIQVMGPGCAKCDEAEQRVKNVVAENNLAAEIEKVTTLQVMEVLCAFSTPGVG